MGLREKIKEKNDQARKEVYIPEWEAKVEVRSISIKQKLKLEHKTSGMALEDAVCYGIVEQTYDIKTGERLFQDEDVAWLRDKNESAVRRLMRAISELRTPDDKREAAEKNS